MKFFVQPFAVIFECRSMRRIGNGPGAEAIPGRDLWTHQSIILSNWPMRLHTVQKRISPGRRSVDYPLNTTIDYHLHPQARTGLMPSAMFVMGRLSALGG